MARWTITTDTWGAWSGASNNVVLVTGSGSVWNCTNDVYVGYSGDGNLLTIASNATLSNGGTNNPLEAHVFGDGYVGYSSDNNAVLVTGGGSVWNNAGDLSVGYSGNGNSLTVANNGTLISGYYNVSLDTYGVGTSYIGYVSGNNAVLVTGSGSVWSNAEDLYVGDSGSGNSLTIASNGTVYNNGDLRGNYGYGYIGYAGDNNAVVVTGNGSVWRNANDFYIGNYGAGNSLTISNGAAVYIDPSYIFAPNPITYIGAQTGATSNSVLVTGSGSVWNNASDLYVGSNGMGNSLTISNGGAAYDGSGYIGYQSGASNNTVLVTGNGSVWSNTNSVYVGYAGAGNSLAVGNGGHVAWNAGGAIGYASGSSNNSVVVASGGSLAVTNADGNATLFVSQAGGADSLILNGGTVTVNQLYLLNGSNSVFTFNAGTLNGGGAIVTTPQNFVVGDGTDAAEFHLMGGEYSFCPWKPGDSERGVARWLRRHQWQRAGGCGRHRACQLRRDACLLPQRDQQRHHRPDKRHHREFFRTGGQQRADQRRQRERGFPGRAGEQWRGVDRSRRAHFQHHACRQQHQLSGRSIGHRHHGPTPALPLA